MAFSGWATTRISLGAVILLVLSNLGATGLRTWKETAGDFPSGQNVNTRVEGNGLTLEGGAASPYWTRVGNDSFPPGRYLNAMAFDSTNGVQIMFGGKVDGYALDNRTWTYDGLQDRWNALSPVPSPPGRYALAMAYDSRDGVTVLFGGRSQNQLNDTWTYNLTLDAWTEKRPALSPPARELHSMAYDPNTGLVVLFGGLTIHYGSHDSELNDTWVYDLANNSWTNRTGAAGPSPRHAQSMCYDPSIGKIVLFGGAIGDGFTCYQDTWTYDAGTNTWTELNPSARPDSRAGAPMAADLSSGKLYLFGGVIYGNIFADVWSYNGSANTWIRDWFPMGPSARSYAVMCYDAPIHCFILYGGLSLGEHSDDYWNYDPARKLWTKLDGLVTPEPRSGHSFAYDSANRLGVLFGGYSGSDYHNDTWTYDILTNRWDRKQPALSPPGRSSAPMCFDRGNGVAVLFGGRSRYSSDPTDETWTYKVSSNTWTECKPPATPSWSFGCSMAYDPDSHLMVLFGTQGPTRISNETWTYDVKANVWTNRTKAAAPPGRMYPAMAYDEGSRTMILFGGENIDYHSGGFYADTWSYNTSTFSWTQRFPASSPPALWGHSMASDSAHGQVFLFGGAGPDYTEPFGETWAYNGTAGQWTNITPPLSPEPRQWAGLYYDSNADAAVLYGGRGDNGPMGDTWLLSPGGGSLSGSYTSAPKDTGGSACFGALLWDASVPASASLKLQLRTGASQSDLTEKDFSGPDGTAGSFFTASGQGIPSMHNGSRWVQYRAFLTAGDSSKKPSLTSVTVNYNLVQSIAITSPAGGANWTGVQPIRWTASDPDNDALSFDIFLLSSGGIARLASGLPGGTREWSWDTSGVPDGSYKILVVASDENPSIPITVNATSGDFVIYHPVPPLINHRPHVTLLSPQNNSILSANSIRLLWKGTDIDGDVLTFTVRYSDQPFSSGGVLERTTKAEYLDLGGLAWNRTHYWTVDASDGIFNGTDVPTEVWRFTITTPPVNSPIRIISTPPEFAWTGQEYAYNITTADDDGDVPAFSIISGPSNLTLDRAAGRLRWTPGAADIGGHDVIIQAVDGRGSWDNQSFTIRVLETVALPPTCTISSPANGSKVSGTVQIRGTAARGRLAVASVFVRMDGSEWKLASGLENWTFVADLNNATAGKHRIEARSFDGALYSETASLDIVIRSPQSNVTMEPFPFCIPAIIICSVFGLGLFFLYRKRSKS